MTAESGKTWSDVRPGRYSLVMSSDTHHDAGRDVHAQIRELQAVVDKVSTDMCGHPSAEVRDALQREVDALGNGASISGPDLTSCAEAVAAGRSMRLTDEGRLVRD